MFMMAEQVRKVKEKVLEEKKKKGP